MKPEKGFLLGLSLLVACTAAGVTAYDAWDRRQFEVRSPLAAGLPSSEEKADDIFRERVQERFPEGTPAAELMRELAAQSFVDSNKFVRGLSSRATEPVDSLNGEYLLMRNSSWLFGCWQRWEVSWTMTRHGQISVLNTQYQHVCS
jgi:hypothetical protein